MYSITWHHSAASRTRIGLLKRYWTKSEYFYKLTLSIKWLYKAKLTILRHNTEKVIYFLLLDRKLKNPCDEDDNEIVARSRTVDAPRKRVDKFKSNGGQYSQLTVGSPVVGRRGFVVNHGPRHQSCHTTPLQSPCTSPIVTSKDMFMRGDHGNHHNMDNSDNISLSSNNSNNINQQIRSRLNSFKIGNVFSTPRFYNRRKHSQQSCKYILWHYISSDFIMCASHSKLMQ